jgi:hypothetical protein
MVANSGSFTRPANPFGRVPQNKIYIKGVKRASGIACYLTQVSTPLSRRFQGLRWNPARADADAFPSPPECSSGWRERFIRAGRKEGYITIFQIADWILRIANQKTIQKEWKNQNAWYAFWFLNMLL